MPHYFLPLKLQQREFTPEVLQEIGSIVVCWADLEDAFDTGIGFFSKHPEVAALIGHGHPKEFKRRLKVWRQAAKIILRDFPHFLPRVTGISDGAITLATWRNALNHGHLAMKDGECILWTKRYIGTQLARGKHTFPATTLKVLGANIRNLTAEVHGVTTNLLLGVHRLKVEESQA